MDAALLEALEVNSGSADTDSSNPKSAPSPKIVHLTSEELKIAGKLRTRAPAGPSSYDKLTPTPENEASTPPVESESTVRDKSPVIKKTRKRPSSPSNNVTRTNRRGKTKRPRK